MRVHQVWMAPLMDFRPSRAALDQSPLHPLTSPVSMSTIAPWCSTKPTAVAIPKQLASMPLLLMRSQHRRRSAVHSSLVVAARPDRHKLKMATQPLHPRFVPSVATTCAERSQSSSTSILRIAHAKRRNACQPLPQAMRLRAIHHIDKLVRCELMKAGLLVRHRQSSRSDNAWLLVQVSV